MDEVPPVESPRCWDADGGIVPMGRRGRTEKCILQNALSMLRRVACVIGLGNLRHLKFFGRSLELHGIRREAGWHRENISSLTVIFETVRDVLFAKVPDI